MWQLKNIHLAIDDRPILKGIDAQIHPGDFIALKGANGAGKSTLFHALSGSLMPCEGQILYQGNDITTLDESQRTVWIGKLCQDPKQTCACEMSVEENITIAKMKKRRALLRQASYEFDEKTLSIAQEIGFDLKTLRKNKVASLSGGQRQTLALIMVLLSEPQLLLLDEPCAALDEETSSKLLSFIQAWVKKHNVASIMITHQLNEIERVCNRQWTLKAGRL